MSNLFFTTIPEFETRGRLRPLLRKCFSMLIMYFNTYKNKYNGEYSRLVQAILTTATKCGTNECKIIELSTTLYNEFRRRNKEESTTGEKLDKVISLLEASERPQSSIFSSENDMKKQDSNEEKLNSILSLLRENLSFRNDDQKIHFNDVNMSLDEHSDDRLSPSEKVSVNAFTHMMQSQKDPRHILTTSKGQRLKDILIHISENGYLRTYGLKHSDASFIDRKNTCHYEMVLNFVEEKKGLYLPELEVLQNQTTTTTKESIITASKIIEDKVIGRILELQGLNRSETRATGSYLGLAKRLREMKKGTS